QGAADQVRDVVADHGEPHLVRRLAQHPRPQQRGAGRAAGHADVEQHVAAGAGLVGALGALLRAGDRGRGAGVLDPLGRAVLKALPRALLQDRGAGERRPAAALGLHPALGERPALGEHVAPYGQAIALTDGPHEGGGQVAQAPAGGPLGGVGEQPEPPAAEQRAGPGAQLAGHEHVERPGHRLITGLVTELVPPKQNWLRPALAPTTKNSKQSADGLTVTRVSGASSSQRSSGCEVSKAGIDWLSMSLRNGSLVARWMASLMSSGVHPAAANAAAWSGAISSRLEKAPWNGYPASSGASFLISQAPADGVPTACEVRVAQLSMSFSGSEFWKSKNSVIPYG